MITSDNITGVALKTAKNLGVKPATVLDVGASVGTPWLYDLFPESHHVLIDPLEENARYMKHACEGLKSAEYIVAAASDRDGTGLIQFSENMTFSSMIGDSTDIKPGKSVREVPFISIDNLVTSRGLRGPFMIKIDVDGCEFHVIKGARKTLESTECVMFEFCLYNKLSMQALQLLWFLNFRILDIVDPIRRELDKALWQFDVVLVSKRYHEIIGSQVWWEHPEEPKVTWRDKEILRLYPETKRSDT